MQHLRFFFITLMVMLASTCNATSAMFYVFRADGKLVIADQSTYNSITKQQGTTPGLTEINKSSGVTLPQKISMMDAIQAIQSKPNVTVAFITQGEQVAELTIVQDKKSYTMSVDDQYDPTRAQDYFGGILATLIPDADALVAILKPGSTLTRTLVATAGAAPTSTSAPVTSQAALTPTIISTAALNNNITNQISQCPICLDDIQAGQPLDLCKTCNNAWHEQCVGASAPSNLSTCPVCRGKNILRMAMIQESASQQSNTQVQIPSSALPPIKSVTKQVKTTIQNSMPDIPSSSLVPEDMSTQVQIPSSAIKGAVKQAKTAAQNSMPDIPSSSLVPEDMSAQVQIPSSSLPPIKTATQQAKSIFKAAADAFDKSASTLAEYYVYLQDGNVYLTYDKAIAQGIKETNQTNALIITRMTTPTNREFVMSNITKAKNYFAAIPGDMTLLVYQNKNVIAKIACKSGALIKNIVYFDKAKRDTLIKDYGTALRYLLGLDSNTKKYESSLVVGKP